MRDLFREFLRLGEKHRDRMKKKKAVNVVETTRYVNSRVARANLRVIILCNNIPISRKTCRKGRGKKGNRAFVPFRFDLSGQPIIANQSVFG